MRASPGYARGFTLHAIFIVVGWEQRRFAIKIVPKINTTPEPTLANKEAGHGQTHRRTHVPRTPILSYVRKYLKQIVFAKAVRIPGALALGVFIWYRWSRLTGQ